LHDDEKLLKGRMEHIEDGKDQTFQRERIFKRKPGLVLSIVVFYILEYHSASAMPLW